MHGSNAIAREGGIFSNEHAGPAAPFLLEAKITEDYEAQCH